MGPDRLGEISRDLTARIRCFMKWQRSILLDGFARLSTRRATETETDQLEAAAWRMR